MVTTHSSFSFKDAISAFAYSFSQPLSHSNNTRFKKRSSIPLFPGFSLFEPKDGLEALRAGSRAEI
jgi:hypothetical protein